MESNNKSAYRTPVPVYGMQEVKGYCSALKLKKDEKIPNYSDIVLFGTILDSINANYAYKTDRICRCTGKADPNKNNTEPIETVIFSETETGKLYFVCDEICQVEEITIEEMLSLPTHELTSDIDRSVSMRYPKQEEINAWILANKYPFSEYEITEFIRLIETFDNFDEIFEILRRKYNLSKFEVPNDLDFTDPNNNLDFIDPSISRTIPVDYKNIADFYAMSEEELDETTKPKQKILSKQ